MYLIDIINPFFHSVEVFLILKCITLRTYLRLEVKQSLHCSKTLAQT